MEPAVRNVCLLLKKHQNNETKKALWNGAAKIQKGHEQTAPSDNRKSVLMEPIAIKKLYASAKKKLPTIEESPVCIESSQEVEQEVQKVQPPKYKQYFDSHKLCMVRLWSDGSMERASMLKTSTGFAKAVFSDGSEMLTECPNLLLEPPKKQESNKRKRVGTVQKKPATKNQEPALAPCVATRIKAVLPVADAAEEAATKRYVSMWYKNANAFGIRRKFGDSKQIFSFGGKGKEKESLARVAAEALAKLHSGLLEEDVCQWARAEASNL